MLDFGPRIWLMYKSTEAPFPQKGMCNVGGFISTKCFPQDLSVSVASLRDHILTLNRISQTTMFFFPFNVRSMLCSL